MSYRESLVSFKKQDVLNYKKLNSFDALSNCLGLKKDEDDPEPFLGNFPVSSQNLIYLFVLTKKQIGTPFFDFSIGETVFQILDKNDLKTLIDLYHKEIIKDLKKTVDESLTNPDVAINYLYNKKQHWDTSIHPEFLRDLMSPFNLSDKDTNEYSVCKIPLIEYQIFNLVYIYNTFNWENDFLILKGF